VFAGVRVRSGRQGGEQQRDAERGWPPASPAPANPPADSRRCCHYSKLTVAVSLGVGLTSLASSSLTWPLALLVCGEVVTTASKVQV
jgi:hypothetical protein